MINRMTASKDLLKARNDAGITQEKLAEKTGLTVQTISAIENDKITPQSMTIYKLNQYFLARKS